MADSSFIFESGDAVHVGSPVENDYVEEDGSLVSDGDVSEFVFISGRGLGAGELVFYTDYTDTVYELNYSDFSVKRSWTVGFTPHGVGGDGQVIWVGDETNSQIRKYDYENFNLLDTFSYNLQSDERITDVGGSANALYSGIDVGGAGSGTGTGEIWILDPDNGSKLQTITPSGTEEEVGGTGGTSNIFWNGNYDESQDPAPTTMYERDPDSGSSLRSGNPGIEQVVGSGGSQERLYVCSNSTGKIYELDPADFSVLRSASVPSTPVAGCGGM